MAPKKPASKKPVAKSKSVPSKAAATKEVAAVRKAAPARKAGSAGPAKPVAAKAAAAVKTAEVARKAAPAKQVARSKQVAPAKQASKPRGVPGELVDPKGTGDITDVIALAAGEAATFTVEATVAYQKASWDVGKLEGPVDVTVGALVGQVPKAWGEPSVSGGALAWTLSDAVIRLFAGPRPTAVPTLDQWTGMRRQILTDDWLIVGQKQVEHPSGTVAYETAEVCAVAPRAVRAVRALFVPSAFATLTLVCPGPIPTARGRELAQAFRTLKVAQPAS